MITKMHPPSLADPQLSLAHVAPSNKELITQSTNCFCIRIIALLRSEFANDDVATVALTSGSRKTAADES
ncbi:hypothetical protein L596_005417 [Steinernema carpocapsae]|uniref:Uncharacterized protein n=1 Tax=Steinernema carpocapsae TaxID=34508 RepID=A0A4U8V3P3_STECR|nr:hypothetical protein L596_005417 [Steinernema carpocapsae]